VDFVPAFVTVVRAPIPKFASCRGDLGCELRNQRSSGSLLI
jgi:hypothetical protein